MRHRIRAVALRGVDAALEHRLAAIAAAGALTILNLHRLDDHEGGAYEAMRPALFDELLGWLTRRFRLVTFADLPALEPSGRPPLILSFDDGYRDFVETAMPILARHGVSANQNVIPACIESGRPPMNVMLRDFIGQAPAKLLREFEMPGLAGPLDPEDRRRAGDRASAALKNRPFAEQTAIFAGLERQFARFDRLRFTPMMTREEVREAASRHEIGAHSFAHASMAAETDAFLREDLARCRDYFSDALGLTPSVYAFPNGSHREGQPELVRAAGFAHVLLVGRRFSRSDVWCHPRFALHATGTAAARFRALGGLRAISRRSIAN